MFFGERRRRREQELVEKDRWRVARKLMEEDVTVLGEQVAELHVDTLADELDADASDHYRRALELYDQATHCWRRAGQPTTSPRSSRSSPTRATTGPR